MLYNFSCSAGSSHLLMPVLVTPIVAYPELVSGGGSKSRKFKWRVKVGAQ